MSPNIRGEGGIQAHSPVLRSPWSPPLFRPEHPERKHSDKAECSQTLPTLTEIGSTFLFIHRLVGQTCKNLFPFGKCSLMSFNWDMRKCLFPEGDFELSFSQILIVILLRSEAFEELYTQHLSIFSLRGLNRFKFAVVCRSTTAKRNTDSHQCRPLPARRRSPVGLGHLWDRLGLSEKQTRGEKKSCFFSP